MNSEKKKVLHATFISSGVEIDLDRFFYTPEGIEVWNNDLKLVNQQAPDFFLEREQVKHLPRSERSWDPWHKNFDPSMIPNFDSEMIEAVFNVVTNDPKFKSRLLEAVHETARDLHRLGFINKNKKRKYDALCMEPVHEYDAEKVRALKIMEEENAPFFIKWYRKARRALDKLMCKP